MSGTDNNDMSASGQGSIRKIVVRYRRKTQETSNSALERDNSIIYSETLSIDRDEGTLELICSLGDLVRTSNKVYAPKSVYGLLNKFCLDGFIDTEEYPEDIIENESEDPKYKTVITTDSGEVYSVSGHFIKYDLPKIWGSFAENIAGFVSFFSGGEIFSERIYNRSLRRKSDLIFCNVTFDEYGDEYCYLADEDVYAVGDLVVVPAGTSGRKAVVKIVSIEYHPPEDAPYPLEKIKHIISKYSGNEKTEKNKMNHSDKPDTNPE
ncbi:MAG: hypothetical protein IKS19_06775 [Clostridia bacterium]|nr:hypothetical protein [Clostridia bacterium]